MDQKKYINQAKEIIIVIKEKGLEKYTVSIQPEKEFDELIGSNGQNFLSTEIYEFNSLNDADEYITKYVEANKLQSIN